MGKNFNASQQKNMIDVAKLFFSFCVVGIHTNVLENFPEKTEWFIMHLVFRMAVPFFFVSSGYFLGEKLNKDKDNYKAIINGYRAKLFPPFFFWGLIGLVLYAVELKILGYDLFKIIVLSVRTAICYPQGAMWFVAACIVDSIILQLIIDKKIKTRNVTIIALLLFGFALVSNSYYFLIENTFFQIIVDIYRRVFMSVRNGVFLFVYMWLGYLLSNANVNEFLNKKRKWVRIILFVSLITLVAEVNYTYGKHVVDDSSVFVSFLVAVPLLVFECINYQLRSKLPYREMRSLSTVLYYVHPPFTNCIKMLWDLNGVLFFCIVCACCMLFYILKSHSGILKKIL